MSATQRDLSELSRISSRGGPRILVYLTNAVWLELRVHGDGNILEEMRLSRKKRVAWCRGLIYCSHSFHSLNDGRLDYLKGRVRARVKESERENVRVHAREWNHSPVHSLNGYRLKSHARSSSRVFHMGTAAQGLRPSSTGSLCASTELHWQWSSQDLNWHYDRGYSDPMLALPEAFVDYNQ